MKKKPDIIIDDGEGHRLFFDREENYLWIALESSGETMDEIRKATEAFIVASDAEDIDALILALIKARRHFVE